MRVATINISGNVGKTTVAKNLLYPRLPGACLFEIESLNTGLQLTPVAVKTIRAGSYGAMIDAIMPVESAIIDVGASNVEAFLGEMHQLEGSHVEFDYFVIPMVKDDKVIKESIKTALLLADLGVAKDKIKLVFNRFPKELDAYEALGHVFKLANAEGFTLRRSAVIYENPVYAALNKVGASLLELNNDHTDYRTELHNAKNEREQQLALVMIANKRRASSATKNLDTVFSALFDKD